MIRHVVLFRWTGETTEGQKQRVAAEIARLPSLPAGTGRIDAANSLSVAQT